MREGTNGTTPAGRNAAPRKVWTTKQMVTLAIFIAISAVLSFIEIPLMPAAPWLKYDPSGVVSLVGSFIFGPVSGALIALLSWVPRLVTNPVGAVMNIFAAAALVIPAGYIYRKVHTQRGAVVGMVVGALLSIIVSIVLNFIATPLYFGGTVADVMKMVLPILVPFNLIKVAINCVIVLLIYKPVHRMVDSLASNKKGAR